MLMRVPMPAPEYSNLYVAGAAPFVTCGVAFPTLSIAAFTLRLADHLRAEIAPGAVARSGI